MPVPSRKENPLMERWAVLTCCVIALCLAVAAAIKRVRDNGITESLGQLPDAGIKITETRGWPAPDQVIGERTAIHAAA